MVTMGAYEATTDLPRDPSPTPYDHPFPETGGPQPQSRLASQIASKASTVLYGGFPPPSCNHWLHGSDIMLRADAFKETFLHLATNGSTQSPIHIRTI